MKGYRQKLDKTDLFPLNEDDTSACVVPRFENYWNQEADYIKRFAVFALICLITFVKLPLQINFFRINL